MKYVLATVAVIVTLVLVLATVKKVSPVSWGWWGTTNTSSGVALKGVDPLAYFDEAEPVPGDSQYSHAWQDAVWHFSSAENRDRFAENPVDFAPQFGSFCAFAVSKGFTADISPDAWHIEDGQLFVFADKNVRDEWVAGLADGSLDVSRRNWNKR